ncbi:alpha/beta hydrolase [Streptomyces sp. NPDC026673]|uniref:alpha/beta hydrolase n=1 Tax=Streptomyces sp. NPDC026673 TaxID=3155724 RepID=UPI0033C00B3C
MTTTAPPPSPDPGNRSGPDPDSGTGSAVRLDPYARRFLDAVREAGGPPLEALSPRQARARAAAGSGTPVVLPPADIDEREIEAGPGRSVLLRTVRPRGARGPLPVVVYAHGGGWVLGDRHTYDRAVRELAHASGAAVAFVEYSRSPEARYPTALREVYAAVAWLARHGAVLGLDGTRLAVAGDSAGANLATAAAMLAARRGTPRLRAQVLFYPALDAGFDTPSYREFAEDHFLTESQMRWFWDQYTPDATARTEPAAAPARAAAEDLAGLPPTLVVTAEADVLRDEGEAYARALLAAGVEVTAVRYLGTVHSFTAQDPLAGSPAARAATAQAGWMLRQALAVPDPDPGPRPGPDPR